MSDCIQQVGSSLEALTDAYTRITQNLANASTPGFKRQLSGFVSEFGDGGANISAAQNSDFTQGSLKQTQRALDLAINGDGFFVVETPKGPLYTRYGSFQLNAQRQLVDSVGRTVSGQSGPITFPPDAAADSIQISRQGVISAAGSNIGRLKIVDFEDPHRLTHAGGTHFEAPGDIEPRNATSSTIQQGFVESSNVNIARELVDLITVSRMYQANVKCISTQDDRMKHLLQVAMA